MSTHKSKLFKKVFVENADDMITLNGPKLNVITQETFVPLMGQMWAKTKARYKKRYRQKALLFTVWCADNYYLSGNGWHPNSEEEHQTGRGTEELFEIWKKEN